MADSVGVVEDEITVGLARIFLSEATGTALLLLFGVGVCCNCTLAKLASRNDGWLTVCFGWALGVLVGVIAAGRSASHLNPAVTLGVTVKELLANGSDAIFVRGVRITAASFFTYLAGEFVGAFIGAVLAYMTFKKHFDEEDQEPDAVRCVFCTAPAIRSLPWNLCTEIICTFVLVFSIFSFDNEAAGWSAFLGPLTVMFVILGCGISLGGPTGFAMNPARDLAPRIAHAILPIPNKAGGDWSYAWVPVLGPIIGGALAGLLGYAYYLI